MGQVLVWKGTTGKKNLRAAAPFFTCSYWHIQLPHFTTGERRFTASRGPRAQIQLIAAVTPAQSESQVQTCSPVGQNVGVESQQEVASLPTGACSVPSARNSTASRAKHSTGSWGCAASRSGNTRSLLLKLLCDRLYISSGSCDGVTRISSGTSLEPSSLQLIPQLLSAHLFFVLFCF